MSDTTPTAAGWYSDANTGGTKYWDGSRWTGDARPPRRPFAAAGQDKNLGFGLLGLGAFFLVTNFIYTGSDGGLTAMAYVAGPLLMAGGVYMLRGQGPTTEAVEARLAKERNEAKAKRRKANVAGVATSLLRLGREQAPAPQPSPEAVAAAQIGAISDPVTAKALQNLQNLLYTRAITDEEYAAAKAKIFGTVALVDQFAQIEQLSELHRQGILGDLEFAAAKARVLGL